MKCAAELFSMNTLTRTVADMPTIERTIKYCEEVIGGYLEKLANEGTLKQVINNYSCEGDHNGFSDFTFCNRINDNPVFLYPSKRGYLYANGRYEVVANKEERLHLPTLIEYCRKFCIEVKMRDWSYYYNSTTYAKGLYLYFILNPKC